MSAALEKIMPALALLNREERNVVRQYLIGLAEKEHGESTVTADVPVLIEEVVRREELK